MPSSFTERACRGRESTGGVRGEGVGRQERGEVGGGKKGSGREERLGEQNAGRLGGQNSRLGVENSLHDERVRARRVSDAVRSSCLASLLPRERMRVNLRSRGVRCAFATTACQPLCVGLGVACVGLGVACWSPCVFPLDWREARRYRHSRGKRSLPNCAGMWCMCALATTRPGKRQCWEGRQGGGGAGGGRDEEVGGKHANSPVRAR